MRAIADTHTWVENRPSSGFRGFRLGELWAYRELVGFLAERDLKVRYKQAALGVLWAILQPVAGAVVFKVVFGRLAAVPSDGIPYLVFAYVGFSVWSYVSTSLTGAQDSLVANASLVTKVYFPRLAAPVASVLPSLLDLAISFVILAVLMVVAGVTPGIELLTTPVFILWMVASALGVGLWMATLNVQYRDVRHAYGLVTQLWLFASPVAYPASLIENDVWRHVYALNPLVGVLEGLRWAVLDGPWPGASLLAVSAFSTAAIALTGLLYFQQVERRFADVI